MTPPPRRAGKGVRPGFKWPPQAISEDFTAISEVANLEKKTDGKPKHDMYKLHLSAPDFARLPSALNGKNTLAEPLLPLFLPQRAVLVAVATGIERSQDGAASGAVQGQQGEFLRWLQACAQESDRGTRELAGAVLGHSSMQALAFM